MQVLVFKAPSMAGVFDDDALMDVEGWPAGGFRPDRSAKVFKFERIDILAPVADHLSRPAGGPETASARTDREPAVL